MRVSISVRQSIMRRYNRIVDNQLLVNGGLVITTGNDRKAADYYSRWIKPHYRQMINPNRYLANHLLHFATTMLRAGHQDALDIMMCRPTITDSGDNNILHIIAGMVTAVYEDIDYLVPGNIVADLMHAKNWLDETPGLVATFIDWCDDNGYNV